MIIYKDNWIKNPDESFDALVKDLQWVKRGNTPRMEYYVNSFGVPYTYGVGDYAREYVAQPTHDVIEAIGKQLFDEYGVTFEVCFLNRYENQSDHLGWHADDSPEMDDDRPIAIVSLGVAREIWFKPQGSGNESIIKQTLGHGSLCLMPAGFQDTHYHRIPKASFQCGRRISLTYRGYKND